VCVCVCVCVSIDDLSSLKSDIWWHSLSQFTIISEQTFVPIIQSVY